MLAHLSRRQLVQVIFALILDFRVQGLHALRLACPLGDGQLRLCLAVEALSFFFRSVGVGHEGALARSMPIEADAQPVG